MGQDVSHQPRTEEARKKDLTDFGGFVGKLEKTSGLHQKQPPAGKKLLLLAGEEVFVNLV